jgi:hypothetical protein
VFTFFAVAAVVVGTDFADFAGPAFDEVDCLASEGAALVSVDIVHGSNDGGVVSLLLLVLSSLPSLSATVGFDDDDDEVVEELDAACPSVKSAGL